jgi:hypothetical protein
MTEYTSWEKLLVCCLRAQQNHRKTGALGHRLPSQA